MKKDIPIFEATIDEQGEGVYAVALVNRPATQTMWAMFSEEEDEAPVQKIALNEEEHKVVAPLCRAEFPIYRVDEKGNPFYLVFSKETIDKMVRLMLMNYKNAINIEHREDWYVDGVYLNQIFIKDKAKGIDPVGFGKCADGSAFCEYKIENTEVWEACKEGVFRSISLEGYFTLKPKEPVLETIEDLLSATGL